MTLIPASNPTSRTGERRLTGRGVLLIFIGFFGVIFAVNAVMLSLAFDTMPGTTTDSAYRASQRFNAGLAAAREREARGWRVEARSSRDPSGVAAVTIGLRDAEGAPLERVQVSARLMHPVHRANDRSLDVMRTGPGLYAATADDVAAGAHDLVIEVERDGVTLYRSRNRIMLP